jgi:hypothetical protein
VLLLLLLVILLLLLSTIARPPPIAACRNVTVGAKNLKPIGCAPTLVPPILCFVVFLANNVVLFGRRRHRIPRLRTSFGLLQAITTICPNNKIQEPPNNGLQGKERCGLSWLIIETKFASCQLVPTCT